MIYVGSACGLKNQDEKDLKENGQFLNHNKTYVNNPITCIITFVGILNFF